MKVLLLAAISVDGRIGLSSDHFADWTSKEDKQFFVEKTREAGAIVMGRKTYDTIGKPLPGRLNVIMTRDTGGCPQSALGELEYTSASPAEIITNLEGRGFESVVIGGGASIYSLFLKESLVTDLYLTIEPILFGSGVPVIDGIDQKELHLESVRNLSDQAVLFHYTIESGPKIDYPYMPEGRMLKYVPFDHPHMQAASQARQELSGDPLWPNGAALVKDDQVVMTAGNGYSNGTQDMHICERIVQNSKSGEGYELCTLHDSPGHAEWMSVKKAKEAGIATEGADLYMYGHWWCCKPCWDAMIEAGIRDVYVTDDAHERFSKPSVYGVTMRPSIKSVYVAGSLTYLGDLGPENDFKEFYRRIGAVVEGLGVTPVIPHIADPENANPQSERDGAEIYKWSVGQVENNDAVIAEVTMPSLGVGGELEAAARLGKPIILISKKGSKVSKFASGNPMVKYHLEYEDFDDAIDKLERIIKMM